MHDLGGDVTKPATDLSFTAGQFTEIFKFRLAVWIDIEAAFVAGAIAVTNFVVAGVDGFCTIRVYMSAE